MSNLQSYKLMLCGFFYHKHRNYCFVYHTVIIGMCISNFNPALFCYQNRAQSSYQKYQQLKEPLLPIIKLLIQGLTVYKAMELNNCKPTINWAISIMLVTQICKHNCYSLLLIVNISHSSATQISHWFSVGCFLNLSPNSPQHGSKAWKNTGNFGGH